MPAIRVHHTATSDARWDGPANENRLKNDGGGDYYRGAFAWQDSDAKNKGDFKFIHHEVSEAGSIGAASVRACVAGIAVLNGARGGTNIPEADRDGVYRHLAAHIKDSGGTPPELKAMKQTRNLDLHLQIKQLSDDGTFTGDLSVYDFVDYGGDVTDKGCFTKSLQDSGGKVPMLYQHDTARPIGHMELTDGETALECKGVFNMDLPDAKLAHSTMKHNLKYGIKTGLSMGYITIKDKVENGIRHLKEVMLMEGSVVTFAMNRMCAVVDVKTAESTPERKDFADELERIQVSDLRYQLLSALWSETYDALYESDNAADAESATRAAVADFLASYIDFINRYFAMQQDSQDGAEMMTFPETALAQKFLAEQHTKITALLEKSRATGTPAGTATDAGAAIQPNEPGNHSGELTPEQKQYIRDFFIKGEN